MELSHLSVSEMVSMSILSPVCCLSEAGSILTMKKIEKTDSDLTGAIP